GIDPATGALMGDARAGQALDLVLTGLLYALLLWVWSGVLVQRRAERWLWAVVMTLVITHLVAPRTATPHYVIFIIPLIFYLRQMSRGRAALLLLALLVLPWLHFLVTVTGKFEHPTVYLPVPFLTLALLWWTRRRWWQTTF
nr:hypothetical protein [Anaerolineae bacterium]